MAESSSGRGRIVCIGEVLVDFLAEEIGAELAEARTFVKAPGGAVANVAVGLARLGAAARFIGKVGNEPFGRFLQQALAQEGLDLDFMVTTDQYPTGLVFVVLDRRRVPRFHLVGSPSADMMLDADEVGPAALAGAAWLHLGTVSMAGEANRRASLKLIRLAGEAGVKISFDPNLRLHMWQDHDLLKQLSRQAFAAAQVVKLSQEELAFLTGRAGLEAGARHIRSLGPEVVVVTRGPEGAWFFCPDGDAPVPGFSVDAVDTTGAGDGFAAGLLAELAGPGPWPPSADTLAAAVRFANAVGAMVSTSVGAVTSLPGRKEAEAFISANLS